MLAAGTILHHFCLFHIQWLITSALHPSMVLNTRKTEGERAVLTDLGTWATGLQVLAPFFSRREFNTWIFCVSKEYGRVFKNIQYWPLPEVNALQFQQEQQGKARVMKPSVKSFLGFSQKTLGNKPAMSSFICSHFNSLFSVQHRWRLGFRQDLRKEH